VETGEDTIPIRKGEDLDIPAIERYLREHIDGLPEGVLSVRQFPAGRSNLTYLVQIGQWEAVLRRPPFGPVPPKAHDMMREAALLQKLHTVYPLAPMPYAICPDPAVIGAPFYVMERKHGVVLDEGFPPGVNPTPELGRRLSEAVVSNLVQLHAIDWQAAGLQEIGYPEGFLPRQVKGWIERYLKSQTEEIAEAEPLMRWLSEHVPPSPAPTIVHNDFKLNNMLLDRDDLARVTGVLDWEMTTIGDPLFDLGVTLSYWIQADDPPELHNLPTVTMLPGFITRQEFMALYAEQSGRDLSAMPFHMIFAYFKLAVIIQQIYARWKRGQTQDERFSVFGPRVRALIEYGSRLVASGAE
jgi:aminoglycoside phosphotransferase (APT) family kinase protein